MLKVSELYLYPVKSLGGIKVEQAIITDMGFEYDRRWMLIDNNNRFLSQREIAKMALLKVSLEPSGLKITDTTNHTNILIPYEPSTNEFVQVIVWDDICTGQLMGAEADKWLSNALNLECRLVYMPDGCERFTDPRYTPAESITSFSDAYPFMMIGQASLDNLNNKLVKALPVDRFRPNIVFTGGTEFMEDTMNSILINNIPFYGVKLCARCNIPTIDQNNMETSKEPLKTLATYRAKSHKIYFGQNLICGDKGMVSVGDAITVLNTHTEERFII
jgi:uncharacterized protein YcbX